MTKEEADKAFKEAVEEYSREARLIMPDSTDWRIARYFFFGGAQFGTQLTVKIYEESFGKNGIKTEVA